jgi:stage II sporulation protein D
MAFEGLGTKITIHGRGFGHGVGMCQYCTKAFADRGRHWRDIVLGFYPGAKLERAY